MSVQRFGDLRCGDCQYGSSATQSHAYCEVLGRALWLESECQVCRDGLRRESHAQQPIRELIGRLWTDLEDCRDRQDWLLEQKYEQDESAGETIDREIEELRRRARDLDEELWRAQRALGRDLSEVIQYLFRRTPGGENRHCPECGWGRIDTATTRCPEHKALLVPDAVST